jgi:hypothetical protein
MTMRIVCFAILLPLLPTLAQAHDTPDCASTIQELRMLTGDPQFSRRWEEVSMDDGKPLVVSIVERNGSLRLEFMKTGEGLWAEIAGALCKTGNDLEARMSRDQISLGSSANWIFRLALANGGVFTLRRHLPSQLQIETRGWSGRFVPSSTD